MPKGRPLEGEEYKSAAVRKLDAFFSGDKAKLAQNYRYGREILKDTTLPTLAAVTEKVKGKVSLPDDQLTHFKDHQRLSNVRPCLGKCNRIVASGEPIDACGDLT